MFLCTAAEHYSDDLSMELEDSMEQEFNMKLEDGSPYEVHWHAAFCKLFTSVLLNQSPLPCMMSNC